MQTAAQLEAERNEEAIRLRMEFIEQNPQLLNLQGDVGMGNNTVGRPRSSRLTDVEKLQIDRQNDSNNVQNKGGLKHSETMGNLRSVEEESYVEQQRKIEQGKATKMQEKNKKNRDNCRIQ